MNERERRKQKNGMSHRPEEMGNDQPALQWSQLLGTPNFHFQGAMTLTKLLSSRDHWNTSFFCTVKCTTVNGPGRI